MTQTIDRMPVQESDAARRSSGIEVHRLTSFIGAELRNVSLADAANDPAVFAEIKDLLLQHKVLFFRDQAISRADHVKLAERFGPLEGHPVAGSDPEYPGLVRIYKDLDSPAEQYENAFHCDATWREAPPMGSVLRCVEGPAVGGDTIWVDMVEAYKRLPEHIKTQIADLRARHSIESTFGAAMPLEKRLALRERFPDAEHPVVRTHPETGEKVLFVNAFTTHFTNFHTAGNVRYGLRLQPRRQRAAQLPDPPGVHPRVPGALALDERTASRSGTTAAPSTTPSRTTSRTSERWSAPASSARRPSDSPALATPPPPCTHHPRTENTHALP